MLFRGKNITTNDLDVDYLSFGNKDKCLIIIPGLGDGFTTVKKVCFLYYLQYKKIISKYKVFVFSRRNNIRECFSTEDMADDIIKMMDLLNIKSASIMGISQGGMISQKLAIKYPDRIEKLILTVTTSRTNMMINDKVSKWIEYANNKDYKSIYIDSCKNSYSNKFLNKYFKYYKIITNFNKPKSYDRFIIQAKSCLEHDTYNELNNIKAPTLVIGSLEDKIVGVDASLELADKIENCELYIYSDYGHDVYIEAKDYIDRVLKFLDN